MSAPTVPALHLSSAPHRLAVATTIGRRRGNQRNGGRGSALRYREIPRPVRPPGWVRVEPLLAGICASDRKTLTVGVGRPLVAFYGLPRQGIVLGHEVVGTVVEADRDAEVSVGDRVVPEPLLSCTHKGFSACVTCAAGDTHRCGRQADGGTAEPGLGFGFHARYGGGWSTELVVPGDRVHRVPDHLDDRAAVLTEPTAVAVHAVLRDAPQPGERAVVIGPGTIGLSVVHALATLTTDVEVVVIGQHETTDALARRAGATAVLHGRRRRLVEAVGDHVGTQVRGGRMSGPVLEHGVDVVYDCVGSEQTIDDALRVLRPGGRLVLVATSAAQAVDWTLVWHRELQVHGTGYYAEEDVPAGRPSIGGGRRRAVSIALDVLGEVDAGHLVTHVFPLDESIDALATAEAGPGAGAVKVAFDPRA